MRVPDARAIQDPAQLLHRDSQLAVIGDALARAAAGEGAVAVLEGSAGLGKSSLLEHARRQAQSDGFGVMWARGSEHEQEFAGGVVLALFARPLHEAGAERTEELLAGLGPAVANLLGSQRRLDDVADAAADPAGAESLSHGLFVLVAQLAAGRPLAVIVDDLHWADPMSRRFIGYLCSRAAELAVAVLLAGRPGDAVQALAALPSATHSELTPLGADAVATLVRRQLPEAADALCDGVAAVSGGNPFFVAELVRATVSADELPSVPLEATPEAIARAIRRRLAGLPGAAVALARALAVLGPGAPAQLTAALAGLDGDAAATAAVHLTAAELLAPADELAFVHPLVAQAIASEIPVHARAAEHLRAARLRHAGGAAPERVAQHLLAATRAGDPWAVEVLRAAARQASATASPESAVAYLQRALVEPPLAADRGSVLAALGAAEAAAGQPGAAGHLAAALALTEDPHSRGELSLALGRALFALGEHEAAAHAFDRGLAEQPAGADPALASQLQAGYIAAATIVPTLRPEALARADAVVAAIDRPRHAGERAILAQAALHAALAGTPRVQVRELAVRAWDGGSLLADETAAGLNWTLVTGALDFTDELELALEVSEAAMADARRLGSPLAFATASYERSIPLYYMGEIARASADAQAAVAATHHGWEMYARSAAYTLSLCQIERDELAAAQQTLSILDREEPGSSIEHPALLHARALLRGRQGRHAEALTDHLEAGRLFEDVFGVLTTGDVPWRVGAAEAALALGDRARAQTLADAELAFALRVGLTRAIIAARRVLGLARGGTEGLALLEQAVAAPAPGEHRLEHLRARVDYGAALRRANRRAAARETLSIALAVAEARGATALARQARVELEAAGGSGAHTRPHGALADLTPSERRVAELAGTGLTNREIALALFITPKTVEFHLRQVFLKLGLRSRRDLPGALADARA